jgi:hypothetical protein
MILDIDYLNCGRKTPFVPNENFEPRTGHKQLESCHQLAAEKKLDMTSIPI